MSSRICSAVAFSFRPCGDFANAAISASSFASKCRSSGSPPAGLRLSARIVGPSAFSLRPVGESKNAVIWRISAVSKYFA